MNTFSLFTKQFKAIENYFPNIDNRSINIQREYAVRAEINFPTSGGKADAIKAQKFQAKFNL